MTLIMLMVKEIMAVIIKCGSVHQNDIKTILSNIKWANNYCRISKK